MIVKEPNRILDGIFDDDHINVLKKGITSYDFPYYLEKINTMITLNEADQLQNLYFMIEKYSLLTPIEEKYILHKIVKAVSNYYNFLGHGYIFVWNLPQYQRNYKAYLWTERYIKYTLKHGDRQLRTIFKLYRFILHDNGVGKVMLEHHRTAILHEMDILLKDYNLNDNNICLPSRDAEKAPLIC